VTGRTALMCASGNPNGATIARLLLNAGADPKLRDERGHSALMEALIADDIEVESALLDAGV
jgi:ankyrin repeat protein